ncbi:MAG: hypothetical protein HZB13_07655 [Acidobacteria bacterium]|nr:hypothetical protein [Acidobacteriota bacterium]
MDVPTVLGRPLTVAWGRPMDVETVRPGGTFPVTVHVKGAQVGPEIVIICE